MQIHSDPGVDRPYRVYGGLFREEAIMLLRRFYVQENEKGEWKPLDCFCCPFVIPSAKVDIAIGLSLISCCVHSTRTQAKKESGTQDGDPACHCYDTYSSCCAFARLARLTYRSGVTVCGTECLRRVQISETINLARIVPSQSVPRSGSLASSGCPVRPREARHVLTPDRQYLRYQPGCLSSSPLLRHFSGITQVLLIAQHYCILYSVLPRNCVRYVYFRRATL